MTNKELLHASLLDILFDGRNKEYGAYTLRKNYNHRLLMALGLGLSVILLFVLINMLKSQDESTVPQEDNPDIIITQVNLPNPKKPEPTPPLQKPKIQELQVATAKVTQPVIVPDNEADKEAMTTQDEMTNKQVSTINQQGRDYEPGTVAQPGIPEGKGEVEVIEKTEPVRPSYAPEFPGGFEALRNWLSRNLATPDDLEAGQTKMVKARFVVDKDGTISTVEIVLSGGKDFDKEVMRVCKKMPKWRPAVQNGEPVTTHYILPVTFMGIE